MNTFPYSDTCIKIDTWYYNYEKQPKNTATSKIKITYTKSHNSKTEYDCIVFSTCASYRVLQTIQSVWKPNMTVMVVV